MRTSSRPSHAAAGSREGAARAARPRQAGPPHVSNVGPLAGALRQLSQLLDRLGLPYMVIGGVANLVWGEPRTTQDVDVTVSVAREKLDETVPLAQKVIDEERAKLKL